MVYLLFQRFIYTAENIYKCLLLLQVNYRTNVLHNCLIIMHDLTHTYFEYLFTFPPLFIYFIYFSNAPSYHSSDYSINEV
jgi:hypothetical protein